MLQRSKKWSGWSQHGTMDVDMFLSLDGGKAGVAIHKSLIGRPHAGTGTFAAKRLVQGRTLCMSTDIACR